MVQFCGVELGGQMKSWLLCNLTCKTPGKEIYNKIIIKCVTCILNLRYKYCNYSKGSKTFMGRKLQPR